MAETNKIGKLDKNAIGNKEGESENDSKVLTSSWQENGNRSREQNSILISLQGH